LTVGDGKDTVNVGASVVDTLGVSTAATETEATARMVTITDVAAGDTIDFLTATTAGTAAALGTKTSTGSATTLVEALNALANVSGTGVTWGQYGGNTYIVYDGVDASTGISAGDIVVKLTGLVDLSLSSYGATAGALLIV
jgi:S-layer protein